MGKIHSFLLMTTLAAVPAVVSAADDGIHRPVSSREIDSLNRQISDSSGSSVEGIGEYHTETGDLNNRLDFWRAGGQFNYRPGSATTYYIRAVDTNYMTTGNFLNRNGFNATGGVKTNVSESVSLQFEGGATRFNTSATTVNGMGTLRYHTAGGSELYATGSRTNVEETLLSATGVVAASGPFAGQLVGLVMDNRAVGGGRYQVTPRFDLSAEGGAGVRDGRNIESNPFRVASAGVGYNIVSRGDDQPVSLVRAGYGLDYFGFDKDLFGFGGASLGGVSGPGGVGGYFSPHDYVSNVGRLEIQGHPDKAFEYRLSGFMGSQDYTGSQMRQAHGFTAGVTLHLSDRVSLPVTYIYDNFGPFTQQSVLFRLVARM